MADIFNKPLRPSDVKVAIYGGLRLGRVMRAGWDFQPSVGIVAKDVERFGMAFESFREPLQQAIKRVMIPSIRKNFQRGGRPEPGWAPLAPFTIKIRGNAWPILERTGALRRAATSFRIWTISSTSATIKSLPENVRYGNLHQAGYGYAGAKTLTQPLTGVEAKTVIPQREFILFQDEDIVAIQQIFVDWMMKRAERVGRGWGTS